MVSYKELKALAEEDDSDKEQTSTIGVLVYAIQWHIYRILKGHGSSSDLNSNCDFIRTKYKKIFHLNIGCMLM